MKKLAAELRNCKANPCISMVIPTPVSAFADQNKIQLDLKNCINRTEKQLLVNYSKEEIRELMATVAETTAGIEFNHLKSGIGIYVARGFSRLVYFPFPVSRKITISNSFDIRELTDTIEKMKPYFALILSKGSTRLFQGKGNKLSELTEGGFPIAYEEQFQVHRTSPYSFYNDEESEINQSRMDNFLRKIDKIAAQHIQDKPLIILGVSSHISRFLKVSKHQSQVTGQLTGNFDRMSTSQLEKVVWPEILKYFQDTPEVPAMDA